MFSGVAVLADIAVVAIAIYLCWLVWDVLAPK